MPLLGKCKHIPTIKKNNHNIFLISSVRKNMRLIQMIIIIISQVFETFNASKSFFLFLPQLQLEWTIDFPRRPGNRSVSKTQTNNNELFQV